MSKLIASTEAYPEDFRQEYRDWCEEMGLKEDEDGFQEWCRDEASNQFQEDMENILRYAGYNVPVVITGHLGLWWGEAEIKPVQQDSVYDAILRCIDKADDAIISWVDGKIVVNAFHHDGVNRFVIERADKGLFNYLYD